MSISLPQLISLVFGLIVIAKTLTDYKNKKENRRMFSFWLLLWIAIIIVAFYPMLINEIIARFGAGNYTIGQIAGMGFVFTMFVVYRIYVKANRLEKQLNELIRDIALRDVKKGRKRH